MARLIAVGGSRDRYLSAAGMAGPEAYHWPTGRMIADSHTAPVAIEVGESDGPDRRSGCGAGQRSAMVTEA